MKTTKRGGNGGKNGAGIAETKAGLTIDGQTLKPDPLPPSAAEVPLSSAVDVRREQAKVYREARGGTLDKQDAAKLIWMLDCIRKSIETEEFERRIAELEDRTNTPRQLPAPGSVRPH